MTAMFLHTSMQHSILSCFWWSVEKIGSWFTVRDIKPMICDGLVGQHVYMGGRHLWWCCVAYFSVRQKIGIIRPRELFIYYRYKSPAVFLKKKKDFHHAVTLEFRVKIRDNIFFNLVISSWNRMNKKNAHIESSASSLNHWNSTTWR